MKEIQMQELALKVITVMIPTMKNKRFDFNNLPTRQPEQAFKNIQIRTKQNPKIQVGKKCYGTKRFSLKNHLNFQQIPEVLSFVNAYNQNPPEKDCLPPASNQKVITENKSSNGSWQYDLDNNFIWYPTLDNRLQLRQKPCGFHSSVYEPVLRDNSRMKGSFAQNNQIVRNKSAVTQKITGNNSNVLPVGKKKNWNGSQKCIATLLECEQVISEQEDKECSEHQSQNSTEKQQKRLDKSKPLSSSSFLMQKTYKHYISKKSQKSSSSFKSNNPETGKKGKNIPKKCKKNINSLNNSVIKVKYPQLQKKYIKLDKRFYYIVNSKAKSRSLPKQKGKKHKNVKHSHNVIISNGSLDEYSFQIEEKITPPIQSQLTKKEQKNDKTLASVEGSAMNNSLLIKRTNDLLQKYKGQYDSLKRQKEDYQKKYFQVVQKLNRIKQELQGGDLLEERDTSGSSKEL